MITLNALCFIFFVGNLVSAELEGSYGHDNNTVVLALAVFRHGIRTVDAGTAYPLDPNINASYYPYGVGQLTSKGKELEYNLGRLMRERYDALLGEVYFPEVIEAVSTNVNRTKASLSLVLAGLYPPKGNILEWNKNLDWQPIPFNYIDYDKQEYLTIPMYFCPNYAKEYQKYVDGPEGKKLQDKFDPMYEFLKQNTGKTYNKPIHLFSIHSCFVSQEEWGLPLPEWTKKIWPEQLSDACKAGLASSVATPKLNQLGGGILVKKLINIMKSKANDTLEPEERKLFLYSAHDTNLVYLLGALNSFVPHLIPYGACVLFELHKINEQYYVKVLYQDYTEDQPRTLIIPGCEKLCPLDKFEAVLKPNLPERDNPCGDDVSVHKTESFQRDYYLGRVHYKSVIARYINWAVNVRSQFAKAVIGTTTDAMDMVASFGKNFFKSPLNVDFTDVINKLPKIPTPEINIPKIPGTDQLEKLTSGKPIVNLPKWPKFS